MSVPACIEVRDKNGKGVEFLLDKPYPLRPQPNGLLAPSRDLQVGRVEIELPAKLAAKQQVTLAYTIRPLR